MKHASSSAFLINPSTIRTPLRSLHCGGVGGGSSPALLPPPLVLPSSPLPSSSPAAAPRSTAAAAVVVSPSPTLSLADGSARVGNVAAVTAAAPAAGGPTDDDDDDALAAPVRATTTQARDSAADDRHHEDGCGRLLLARNIIVCSLLLLLLHAAAPVLSSSVAPAQEPRRMSGIPPDSAAARWRGGWLPTLHARPTRLRLQGWGSNAGERIVAPSHNRWARALRAHARHAKLACGRSVDDDDLETVAFSERARVFGARGRSGRERETEIDLMARWEGREER